MRKGRRNDVNYMEFRDGYVLVVRTEPEAIIEGYKKRELKRNELRLFAAMCEQKGLHLRSKVDVARILNCKSDIRGIRRLSSSDIERAQANVRASLDSTHQNDSEPRIAVSRRMLRHAARGGSTSNEIIVMLFYCMNRHFPFAASKVEILSDLCPIQKPNDHAADHVAD